MDRAPSHRTCAVLAALLLGWVIAPGDGRQPVRAAAATTLTIAITAEPDTLDPQVTGTAIGSTIDSYIGDTLVALNPKSRIVPDLASHWSVSPNGLTYSFTLRRAIVFQDGTPLNAAAYVATFDRLLNPATKAAVQAGRLGQVASVTATGAYSFRIVLKQPYAFLLYNLTDSNFMPLSPAALRREGTAFGRHPISTGPWEVQAWDSGTQIVLVRNPHYRGGPTYLRQGPVSIDRLIFRILPNAAAATDALLAGEVDVLALDAASVPRVQATGQFQILKTLDDSSIFLEFNVTRAPFNNLLVRQALNDAVNKQEVVQVALHGFGVPIYGVLNPGVYGYWPGIKQYTYHYNPAKALALLARAGYVQRHGVLEKDGTPLSFTVLTSESYGFNRAALVVQDQLKHLGITMNLEDLQFATEIATIRTGTAQADVMGYTYPLPDIFYIWFDSSQIGTGFADSFYRDPALDALIVTMRTTSDAAARETLIIKLEKYITDRALWVPLYDDYVYTAIQPHVHGVLMDPRNRLILTDATIQ